MELIIACFQEAPRNPFAAYIAGCITLFGAMAAVSACRGFYRALKGA